MFVPARPKSPVEVRAPEMKLILHGRMLVMNTPQPLLQIVIHKADGSSDTFTQNRENLVKDIVGEFQADLVFNRDKILIADGDSLTTFPANRVVRLDLISERLSHWMPSSEIINAVELSQTEFRDLLRNPEMRVQWDPAQPEDEPVVIFLQVEMAGQPSLFLVMEMVSEPWADPLETISALLAAPVLCFRMRSGGVAILNLSHLMCVTLFPGFRQLSMEAWPAQRTHDSQSKHPAAESPERMGERLLSPGFLKGG